MKLSLEAAAILAAAQLSAAQTYTSCNPTEKTCPADTGLAQWSYFSDFTDASALEHWNITAAPVTTTTEGAKFTINKEGQAPTIASEFYIFFGHVDVKMKASAGTGIISTYMLLSDDLDEIDWEQISTYPTSIQTDYFGKGNTTAYDRDTTVPVINPETEFHTYSLDWTPSRINWLLDGEVVRTLNYHDAVDGYNYPQTPCRIKIGIWAGGDPSNGEGTIEWAGGVTDYSAAPFTMYVESVNVTNYYPASSYTYTDKTGAYTSIKLSNSTEGFPSNSVSVKSANSNINSSVTSFDASKSNASTSGATASASTSGNTASASSSLFTPRCF
ncbi:hypothetical protein N7468_001240 [Penicillium chermesinum]|uniref:chitinase n=1 Tax=Penicillium chermesinum TaxID=63820 RepID=A0A9W9PHG2_9EURO|nr:uncharacterized protein N7468_001240 [Penicillium chermesinum]KAJ5246257.1 hypothetical protein N7468_001240 [Penicillium chermesinum]